MKLLSLLKILYLYFFSSVKMKELSNFANLKVIMLSKNNEVKLFHVIKWKMLSTKTTEKRLPYINTKVELKLTSQYYRKF